MSEIVAIYLLGLAYGTILGLLIAFVIWLIKAESEKVRNRK
jgi:hypothetical protein